MSEENFRMPLRAKSLTLQHVGDELLVYDPRAGAAHCLDTTAAEILKRCDGISGRAECARELSMEPSAFEAVLSEFRKLGLLEATLSRRNLVSTGGLLVAGAISTILLPHPTAAQSSCSPCDALNGCAIGTCSCGTACDTGTGCTKACVRCFDTNTDVEFNPALAFCCTPGVGGIGDCFSAATNPGSCVNAKTLAQNNGKGFYCCCP